MAKRKTLSELRREIDAIDAKILKLLAQRARVAQRIGEAKSRRSRGVLDAGRERAVLGAVKAANPGPLSDKAVEAIFREIVSACRAMQHPTRVAFLGPEGTFSHAAALKQFGSTAEYEPVETIADVFASVEAGRACYGVVPIENTTEGAVTPTLDALASTRLHVVAEITVPIEHWLLSKTGRAEDVRRIVSHPQPLAQCRRYLAQHFPGVTTEQAASTADAAARAARRKELAAIASAAAARVYGLKTVAAAIQDEPGNKTRFLVVGDDPMPAPSGNDRTSLVISVHDEVGILGRVLEPFSANGVNLSMIESRPLPGRPWEYSFFIDVVGHVHGRRLKRALARVERIAISTKVLGSYPVAA
ncbi:MAG: prephenate dehydratase [Deltaproteobacteria bacterium]|nr:MAG: prephenate dehydratase [Deltaproteobacteria bacterium]